MLTDQIRDEMMTAMKSGDRVRKSILRVTLGEIQTEASRKGRDLDDAEVEALVRKLLKSNRESLAAGLDPSRGAVLEQEIVLLEALLPKTLSPEEIVGVLEPVAEAIRAARGDGQATGVAMKHLKASGAAVTGQDVAQAVRAMRA